MWAIIVILVGVIFFQEYAFVRQGMKLRLYKARQRKFDAELALIEEQNKLLTFRVKKLYMDRGVPFDEEEEVHTLH